MSEPLTLFQVLLHYFRNVEASGRAPTSVHVIVHDKDSTKPEGEVIAYDTDRPQMLSLVEQQPVGTRVRVLQVFPDMVRTLRPPPEVKAEPTAPAPLSPEDAEAVKTSLDDPLAGKEPEFPVQPVAPRPRVRARPTSGASGA